MISPYRIAPGLVVAAAVLTPAACGGSSSNGAGQGVDAGEEAQAVEGGGGDAANEAGAVDAPSDAPADVDNGAPSTNYPAPHPPLPQLTNQNGGSVLKTPKAYLVVYPGYTYETQLQDFAKKLAASSYWAAVTQEYGVGPIAYAGTIELTGQTAPQNIASTDIGSWVATQIHSGAFGTPDPQAIYTIFYPPGTTVTQPNPVSALLPPAQSCAAFGGYHDNASAVVGDAGSATGFAYSVIPTCGSTIGDLTSVVAHEWVEASTDPLVTATGTFTLTPGPQAAFFSVDPDHVIWGLLGGGEAGDLCQPEGNPIYVTPADIGYPVQRTWSNLQAKGSHDPCAPDVTGAFFDAAPVLTQTVTFSSTITGTLTTKGLTVPVGQSKTIEVDLFSDGDTGGPWTVAAADVLSTYYGNYGLTPSMTFAWDRTQGQNGEKLHLTITVTAASGIGGGHAFMITSSKGGRQAVWPGLVVEQ